MARLISKVYGDALFSYACENNVLEQTYEEVRDILFTFKNEKSLINFLSSPVIKSEEKKDTLKNIFLNGLWQKDSVNKNFILFKKDGMVKGKNTKIFNFINIVIDKGRTNELIRIFEYFIDRVHEKENVGVVNVKSAYPLTDEQKTQLENKLKETTKYNEVQVEYEEDKNLIAGIQVKIGDRVIDSSLQTKLKELSKNLRGVRL